MWIQVKFKKQDPHRLYHYVCLSLVYEYDQVWLNPLLNLISFAFGVVSYGSTSDENLHSNLLLQKRSIRIMLDMYGSKTQ